MSKLFNILPLLLSPVINETEFEDIECPPGDFESQEPPLESELYLRQILLLIQMLESLWQDR
ncbi:hypothetical protein [Lyngbya sp. PCC 8106]|uniref:hypothetical protein n=1 Tax=Lyngbya sp. (strain PCC 8106) TaxID=313612 RepID=UPI0000EAAB68|nr:hypothetical protein L8106_15854 [Lyngbya sp. PCC 8106]